MVKYFKYLLALCLLAASVKAHAQYGLGFQFLNYGFDTAPGTDETGAPVPWKTPKNGSGLGLKGYYIIRPRMRIDLSLNAMNTHRQRTVYDFTAPNTPTIELFYEVEHPFSNLRAEFDYAFTHNFTEKGFTFFGLGGFSANTYHYMVHYGTYLAGNKDAPILGRYPYQSARYHGISLELGLGIEYAFNKTTRLFLDSRIGTGEHTKYIRENLHEGRLLPENFYPGYLCIELGMRFNLHKHIPKKA